MKYQANPVIVDAYKILEVGNVVEQGLALSIDRDVDSIVFATPEMTSRMEPSVGDYWVIQSDGYIYLNPQAVFERKYSRVQPNALQLGAEVRRLGLAGS